MRHASFVRALLLLVLPCSLLAQEHAGFRGDRYVRLHRESVPNHPTIAGEWIAWTTARALDHKRAALFEVTLHRRRITESRIDEVERVRQRGMQGLRFWLADDGTITCRLGNDFFVYRPDGVCEMAADQGLTSPHPAFAGAGCDRVDRIEHGYACWNAEKGRTIVWNATTDCVGSINGWLAIDSVHGDWVFAHTLDRMGCFGVSSWVHYVNMVTGEALRLPVPGQVHHVSMYGIVYEVGRYFRLWDPVTSRTWDALPYDDDGSIPWNDEYRFQFEAIARTDDTRLYITKLQKDMHRQAWEIWYYDLDSVDWITTPDEPKEGPRTPQVPHPNKGAYGIVDQVSQPYSRSELDLLAHILLHEADPAVRGRAARRLGMSNDPTANEVLLSVLPQAVRFKDAVLAGLAFRPDSSIANRILAAPADPPSAAAPTGAITFAILGDAAALEYLEGLTFEGYHVERSAQLARACVADAADSLRTRPRVLEVLLSLRRR